MDLNKFASNKLKELRTRKNLTQEELAEELNITQQQIARYENDQRQFKIDFLFQLSEYFGISINEFFPPIFTHTSDMISDTMGDKSVSIVKLSIMTNISVKELENTISPDNKLPKPSVLKKIAEALNTDFEIFLIGAGYVEDPQDINNILYKTGIRYLLNYNERMIICEYLAQKWNDDESNFKEGFFISTQKVLYTAEKVYNVIFKEEKKTFTNEEVKTIIVGEKKEDLTFAERIATEIIDFNKIIDENTIKEDINGFNKISEENKKTLIDMLDFFIQQSKKNK